jgi:hypothetical protein
MCPGRSAGSADCVLTGGDGGVDCWVVELRLVVVIRLNNVVPVKCGVEQRLGVGEDDRPSTMVSVAQPGPDRFELSLWIKQ